MSGSVFFRPACDFKIGREVGSIRAAPTFNPNSVESDWYNKVVRKVGATQKDKDTAAICNAAKDKEILIYSIAFEVTYDEAELLRTCASNENMHYLVSGNQLDYAFTSIATSLNSLQLIQ